MRKKSGREVRGKKYDRKGLKNTIEKGKSMMGKINGEKYENPIEKGLKIP